MYYFSVIFFIPCFFGCDLIKDTAATTITTGRTPPQNCPAQCDCCLYNAFSWIMLIVMIIITLIVFTVFMRNWLGGSDEEEEEEEFPLQILAENNSSERRERERPNVRHNFLAGL